MKLQVRAKGLFKYVLPLNGSQTLNCYVLFLRVPVNLFSICLFESGTRPSLGVNVVWFSLSTTVRFSFSKMIREFS